jgi:protein required for attachment to host cells
MAGPNAPLGAPTYRVVVADEFQAIFYAREKKFSPLAEIDAMQNVAAREKTGELMSDRGGRAFDSHGQGRHAMTNEKTDPKSQSAIVFAKEIADRLSAERSKGSYDNLIVVAAPRFLGVLRPALDTAGVEAALEIDKEVTGKDAEFIQNLIDAG